jgi:exosortase F-associated protein
VKFALVGGACLLLLAVYIFQRTDIIGWLVPESRELSPALVFSVNRYMRIVLNDVACFCIIYAFFGSRHLALAFWVFLIEILVILPVYLVIKLTLEGDSEISSPLLSQVHRLIVNPVLMFLLILGFLYQKISEKATGRKS